ncbi:LysR family transcriptional regulator [Burkholderia lata]|uniref:LysR family transcriptional regulator n=1 Tax=Burkholderia lata (strain ATCC 17760 / DSM 23089 / LMG 22485 / NCIMB 9086 / R18194 / 383) TaxID=482957 RepID=A0A6P2U5N8_BURL3|nr:LysR family transcriptional regulator [Burkholderia lata]VWC70219.1 LysR family transcriptional regulator [Burkholderia lata]
METIDHFDLRSFDMNLLIAFDALMQERSVTRAAAKLRIQQPAMSHSLSTLRLLLGDELFVRVGRTLQPTPRALSLQHPVRSSLLQLQEALKTEESFDPSNARRDFRVAMTNGIESLLLPDIVARFRTDAPGMTLLARSVDPQDMPDMLDRGELNLAIGCYESTHPWIRRHELFNETLTCCFNPDLLPIKTPIDEQTYIETPHVVVSMRNTVLGCLEDALRDARVELNIVSAGPNFLAVLMMAADAPVLTTLPSRIAHRYADRFGLSTCPVPISFSANPIAMVWHSREDREPGSEWLRQLVRELCPFERAD